MTPWYISLNLFNSRCNIANPRWDSIYIQHEERDDDGETGAADKLLFLLSRMHLENVLVVVTRWYEHSLNPSNALITLTS